MTEEEKAKAEAEAKAKAEAEANDPLKKHNAEIEAQLKAERERANKAEFDLSETRRKAKEAFEVRKKAKEAAGQTIEDDDDKPMTRAEAREFLETQAAQIRNEVGSGRAMEIARSLSNGSDVEAQLTLEIWKNRKLPGSLEEQLEEAHVIANRKRILAQNDELKRALAGDTSVVTDGLNTQRKPAKIDNSPTISPTDRDVYAGMTWDAAKGAYKKVLLSGETFYTKPAKEGEKKKSWVEKTQ